jgi:hypothetical protein
LVGLFREPQARALRAHALGKLDRGVLAKVQLDLVPVPILVLDFLARSADRQQARVFTPASACFNSQTSWSFTASSRLRLLMSRPLISTP